MDYKTEQCLFLTFLLISHINYGESLQCYTCTSPENSICGHDFSSSKVPAVPCPGVEPVCMKGKLRVGADIVVTRTCGTQSSCLVFETCQTCTTDRCNSSTGLKFQLMLLPLVGLTIIKSFF